MKVESTMTSLHASNAQDKPVETIHPSNLPKDSQDPHLTVEALNTLVDRSAQHDDVQQSIHTPMHRILHNKVIQKLIPGIEKVASDYHVGNFVVMRGTGEKFFESMPLYPRYVAGALYERTRMFVY